jgi:hypothetical protein
MEFQKETAFFSVLSAVRFPPWAPECLRNEGAGSSARIVKYIEADNVVGETT